ncbi:hypothetical protein [Mangrovibacterium diazotrophicum]|uniref:Uncharacterized protein n=1 Tax=Mangrovibacterium diazotrophicum TaxID=1261403 RepID=A0A419W4S7_9BACT|nr:hypothetical protein [Mangrovibacterium diazotrophicum]RKD90471.1 hypothetical protein BC643_0811 [Mangrovibacterium diazotrophicum]
MKTAKLTRVLFLLYFIMSHSIFDSLAQNSSTKKIDAYINSAIEGAIYDIKTYPKVKVGKGYFSNRLNNKTWDKIADQLDQAMNDRFRYVVKLPIVVKRGYNVETGNQSTFNSRVIYFVGDCNTYFEFIRSESHSKRTYYVEYKGNFVYGKDEQAIARYFYNVPTDETKKNVQVKKEGVLLDKQFAEEATRSNREFAYQNSDERKAHNQALWGNILDNAVQSTSEFQQEMQTKQNELNTNIDIAYEQDLQTKNANSASTQSNSGSSSANSSRSNSSTNSSESQIQTDTQKNSAPQSEQEETSEADTTGTENSTETTEEFGHAYAVTWQNSAGYWLAVGPVQSLQVGEETETAALGYVRGGDSENHGFLKLIQTCGKFRVYDLGVELNSWDTDAIAWVKKHGYSCSQP